MSGKAKKLKKDKERKNARKSTWLERTLQRNDGGSRCGIVPTYSTLAAFWTATNVKPGSACGGKHARQGVSHSRYMDRWIDTQAGAQVRGS